MPAYIVQGGTGRSQVDTAIAAALAGAQLPYVRLLPYGVNSSGTTPTANTAYLYRFRVIAPVTITSIAVPCTNQSGNIDLGIYSSDGTTLTKVISSGSTACPAAGTAAVTVSSTVLTAGVDYYAAFACDNATAQFLRIAMNAFSNTPDKQGVTIATSFPLPATITLASTTAANLVWDWHAT